MASFMAKLKRKNKFGSFSQKNEKGPITTKNGAALENSPASAVVSPDCSDTPTPSLAPAENVADCLASKRPTVEVSSIFTGLQLSSTVAREEQLDSLYMHKDEASKDRKEIQIEESVDPEVPQSSFSFLHTTEEILSNTSDKEGSISGESNAPAGFSFLHQSSAHTVDSESYPSVQESTLLPSLSESSLPPHSPSSLSKPGTPDVNSEALAYEQRHSEDLLEGAVPEVVKPPAFTVPGRQIPVPGRKQKKKKIKRKAHHPGPVKEISGPCSDEEHTDQIYDGTQQSKVESNALVAPYASEELPDVSLLSSPSIDPVAPEDNVVCDTFGKMDLCHSSSSKERFLPQSEGDMSILKGNSSSFLKGDFSTPQDDDLCPAVMMVTSHSKSSVMPILEDVPLSSSFLSPPTLPECLPQTIDDVAPPCPPEEALVDGTILISAPHSSEQDVDPRPEHSLTLASLLMKYSNGILEMR